MQGFKSGKAWNGNRNGRPKGSYAIHTQLQKAIEKVGKDNEIDVYEHFVKRALKSDTVLISLLRKLVPDRQYSEGDTERIINIIYAYRDKLADSSILEERGIK